MTINKLKEILIKTGIKSFYITAPNGTKVPYITYNMDTENFYADDTPLVDLPSITINYYDIKRNDSNEILIENVLNQHNMPWRKSPDYDDDSKVFVTVYESEGL